MAQEKRRPPSFIDKVNYIVNFVENPCTAPWTLYVETALPVAENMALSLLSFDMQDVIGSMFHPKMPVGNRTRRHGRKGRKGGKEPVKLTEIGNGVGRELKGSNPFFSDTSPNKLQHMWRIYDKLESFLYWVMLADVGVDGLYQWTTLIQKSTFCSRTEHGLIDYKKDLFGTITLVGWEGPTWDTRYPTTDPTGWSSADGVATCHYRPFGGWYWAEARNTHLTPATIELGFWLDSPTGEPEFTSGPVLVPGLGSAHVFVQGTADAGHTLHPACRSQGVTGLSLFNCDVFYT